MTRDQVDEVMKIYRATEARCAYLRSQLDILQEYLERNQQTVVGDQVSLSQAITGMPHGSGVGDPVGNLAMRIAMGKTTVFVEQIQEEISRIKDELDKKKYILMFVDSWLKALTDLEREIVIGKAIDHRSWAEIVHLTNKPGSYPRSKHTVQRIYDLAVEKVYTAAK